jgi:hypothetical protein
MNLYWLKIGGGALAIFGVGMTGIAAAKKGAHELKTVASGSIQQALRDVPAKFLAFRVDGERLGRLRSIDVKAEGGLGKQAVRMEVSLDDPASAADLAHCNLAAENADRGVDDVDFRCVSESDIDDERLAQVGEARFQPGDLVRPLFVPERQLRHLESSDLKSLRANLSSDDGKSVHGNADYDLTDRQGQRQRGTVRLDATDGKALIEIRDQDGRELFHLRADDRGVSFNATDRRGRELLRLIAGEAGVHIDAR